MDGKINIKTIFLKLISKWYYFLIAMFIMLPLAYAYLKFTPKQYQVRASLLLKNEDRNPVGSDQLLNGMDLFTSETELEDEIGILKSYSMVEQAIRELDFGISYYTTQNFVTTERYTDAPFTVELDSVVDHAINLGVYIERLSSQKFRVIAFDKKVSTYDFNTNKIENQTDNIELTAEGKVGEPFVSKHLSFKLKFNDQFKTGKQTQMFFVINTLGSLVENYRYKLNIEPIATKSNIVELGLRGSVAEKEINFLNKLLKVYLANELYKKNQLARKTIQFIDNQLTGISDTLKQVEGTVELNVLPRNERESVETQRSFEFNDNVRNYLLEKRAEAGIAIASNSIQKTIIDKPYQVGSGPVSPNSRMIYAIALFLGLTGTISFVLIKDLLNDNLITYEDVESHTKIPLIGTITHGNKREQGTVVAHARSPIGESFRSLRVNLQYLTLGKNANIIGITSSRESEGKTFCSVNLAAAMAHSGRKTILIDTDMRRPKVASYFQLKSKKGLSNFLVGDITIQEIIHNTETKGLDVIGSGPIPPNPIDLIGHVRMDELMAFLKQNYSTIILDSPPMGYVSEYIILMKYTDANLYIVRSDYTNKNSLGKINKLYEKKKISNVSILLNDLKVTKRSGYGYGYDYKF